jgi:hypothetical protein
MAYNNLSNSYVPPSVYYPQTEVYEPQGEIYEPQPLPLT